MSCLWRRRRAGRNWPGARPPIWGWPPAPGAPTPPGFAVTTAAWRFFVEKNGLRPKLDALLAGIRLSDPVSLREACAAMRGLVLEGVVPDQLAESILRAVKEPAAFGGAGLAVRSSALAEDGEVSFAGQYDSRLNQAPEDVLDAYRFVLASKYRPRAVSYRIRRGLADEETPMAVLVMPMVEAAWAGVAYSRETVGACGGGSAACGLYVSPGLGRTLVEGAFTPMRFCLSRTFPPEMLAEHVDPGETPPSRDALAGIMEAAMFMETLFKQPQDVEWAVDGNGRLFILQTRPFREEREDDEPERPDFSGRPILLEDGCRISGGLASGVVRRVDAVLDADAVPEGAVLCVPALSPSLSKVAHLAGAVVAGVGSRAGHFASIARELRLPVVVVGEGGLGALEEGRAVTVDASSGVVYDGAVQCPALAENASVAPPTPAGGRLGAMLPLLSRLTLLDPASPDFSLEKAESLHDVVRYAHEAAVRAMFNLAQPTAGGGRGAKKLKSGLPAPMYALDLGGGLEKSAAKRREITPEDIASAPMRAVWGGLAAAKARWDPNMPHMDWEGFDRISAGVFAGTPKELAGLALLADGYAHVFFRFGYHFAVVDSVCGPNVKDNHISFRFKGGGGSLEQRRRRLALAAGVLGRGAFEVRTVGDMLEATAAKCSERDSREKLALLGALLAHTRLMDMVLPPDADIEALAAGFPESLEVPDATT